MTKALVLSLQDFEKLFGVNCDAFWAGIRGVLSQDRCPISFFSEKLSNSKRTIPLMILAFYTIVQTLRNWRHYLM
jgi:hypothetical protein